jgi:hypothetical protein
MRYALKLHPDFLCPAVSTIDADAERMSPGQLRLRYVLNGKLSDVRTPVPTSSTRADELWKHTCFEAFVGAPSGDAYYEFNFAPSTQWAAYEFSGYRAGMKVAGELSAAAIAIASDDKRLELSVSLALDRLTKLPADGPWRLGLSAVIEETSGRKSYWALAHPPGKPDFHHSDCFVLTLPAASRS